MIKTFRLRISVVACLLLWIVPCSYAHNAETRNNILIITSYNPDTQRMSELINTLESVISSKKLDLNILIEDMGVRGIDESGEWCFDIGKILGKADLNSLCAIIFLGQEAWSAFLNSDSDTGDVPFFACYSSFNGITLPDSGDDMTEWKIEYMDTRQTAHRIGQSGGYLNLYDVAKNVELIKTLYPSTCNIAFLSDNSYGGISLQTYVKKVMKEQYPDMNLILLDGSKNSPKTIKGMVDRLPSNSAVLIGTWRIDNDGIYFPQSNIADILPTGCDIPVFSISGLGIGTVAVGGYIPEYKVDAGVIVDNIVKYGKGRIDSLEFYDTGNIYSFDRAKLKQYGIEEYQLPNGSEIVDDVEYRIAKIRQYVTVSAVIILIMGFLLVMLVMARSKLKANQTELINAKNKAEESERLKSAFLANMSHEIRTPLNAIVGFSDLLLITDDKEEKEECCRLIKTNNDILLNLINDILDLSKIESGHIDFRPMEFDAVDLFKELNKTFSIQMKTGVELKIDNPYSSCSVVSDRKKIIQIVTNFMTNAIKFTDSGSITMGYKCVDNGFMVYVRDTGIGITNDDRGKIFRRFEKLDAFAQGTGLGLSICRAIVNSQAGRIGVESEVGNGSYFWAWLPCTVRADTKNINQTVEKPQIESHAGGDSVRILVAEDNDSNFMLIRSILKNYAVDRALTGIEAVKMYANGSYDMILMDLKMPELGGIDATRQIRRSDDKIPIIAVTAYAFDSDREIALNAGCNDFITKPVSCAALMKLVKYWLNDR